MRTIIICVYAFPIAEVSQKVAVSVGRLRMYSIRFCILLFFAGVLGWGLISAPLPSAGANGDRFEVFVLGIAQDGGVPHLGCDAVCCTEKRANGERLYPACLGIHDRRTNRLLLIEATPEIQAQVALD